MRSALAALALLACAPPLDDAPTDDVTTDLRTCDASGGRELWLVTDLRFGRIEDGVSDGFDLDGDGGTGGCGGSDVNGVDGEPGVDNAFGALLPILETTEFLIAEEVIAELIRTGELLILGEMVGVDDPMDDDCIGLAMRRAVGVPLLGTDGDPLAGQTLDLDTTFEPLVFDQVELVGGSATGSPVRVTLPVSFLEADLELELTEGAMRVDRHPDGSATGVLAGGLDIDYLVTTIQSVGVAQELKDLANGALRFAADLAPDENGECTRLSVVLTFDATPVFLYDDVWDEVE